jgi:hypothetical protein
VPWRVFAIADCVVTPELRQLCKSDKLERWYRGGVTCNMLGWAIELGDTPLARDIARWCTADQLLYPCYESLTNNDYMTPLVFAMVRDRTDVAIALLERGARPFPHCGLRISNVGVDAHIDRRPFPNYGMCKKIAHARRAALTVLLGGYQNECALAVLPHEMIALIARAVYATRADESWIY